MHKMLIQFFLKMSRKEFLFDYEHNKDLIWFLAVMCRQAKRED